MGIQLSVQLKMSSKEESQNAFYEFEQSRIVIGRSANSDVYLPHPSVSLKHVSIEASGSGYVIIDHGSTNSAYLNQEILPPGVRRNLKKNDLIEVGIFQIEVSFGAVTLTTSFKETQALAKELVRSIFKEEQKSKKLIRKDISPPIDINFDALPNPFTLGREGDISFQAEGVSRIHASIEVIDDEVWLQDEKSKNGVWIGDEKISRIKLKHGQSFYLGQVNFLYEDPFEKKLFDLKSAEDEPVFLPAENNENKEDEKNEEILIEKESMELNVKAPVHKKRVQKKNKELKKTKIPIEMVFIMVAILLFLLSMGALFWLFL